MKPTKEQVINNAVASAEMEGLHPTEADIARIVDLLEKRITHDEFVASVLANVQNAT